jgi:hypothetical protein
MNGKGSKSFGRTLRVLRKVSPLNLKHRGQYEIQKIPVRLVWRCSLSDSRFARMDEGMWPFNNIPRDEIKKKYRL